MTNTNEVIRWIQRFDNYQLALGTLQEAVDLSRQRALSRLEQQGLIQGFEFTHELAWKTLKDFLDYRGVSGVIGSRDAARVAFREEVANEIAEKIINQYFPAFCELKNTLYNWLDDNE